MKKKPEGRIILTSWFFSALNPNKLKNLKEKLTSKGFKPDPKPLTAQ